MYRNGTRFTDGRETIEISIMTWQNGEFQWSEDWSEEFFNLGELEYDEEKEAYIVNDVSYLIDQAEDLKNHVGDYAEVTENIEYDYLVVE